MKTTRPVGLASSSFSYVMILLSADLDFKVKVSEPIHACRTSYKDHFSFYLDAIVKKMLV